MDEILKSLAAHTGISVETAKTALGAVVAFLREHLPEGLSGQLMKSLPEAGNLAAAYESNKSGGGLLMAAVTALATKLLGESSGEATKLLEMLHKSGLDVKQIESFLPKVVELIKAHVPPELFEKILAMFPALNPTGGKS